jgi:hypothetical protein
MGTARAGIADFFRRWRIARDEAKLAKDARRDERDAEELERARAGVDRFPPMGA